MFILVKWLFEQIVENVTVHVAQDDKLEEDRDNKLEEKQARGKVTKTFKDMNEGLVGAATSTEIPELEEDKNDNLEEKRAKDNAAETFKDINEGLEWAATSTEILGNKNGALKKTNLTAKAPENKTGDLVGKEPRAKGMDTLRG